MGFFSKLFGSSNSNSGCTNLLEAKEKLEIKMGKKFEDLNTYARRDFIQKCIDMMFNKSILSKDRVSIIDAIMNTRFGEKNMDVVNYINDLKNPKVEGDVIKVVLDLIVRKIIKYEDSKSWLNNDSLYDRYPWETLYAIRVLAIACSIEFQTENGHNRFFDDDKPLRLEELMDENGVIYNDAKLKDILNDRQTKDIIPNN